MIFYPCTKRFVASIMNKDFSRTITLLRKEKGLSQKKSAQDLNISQALLSHYEKGIRECKLEFVIKCSNYYSVSCDYLLGKSPDRSGATIMLSDIPDPTIFGKDNQLKGSILATLNKKLILNSINILFDLLQKIGYKGLTIEISTYIMTSVYKMFRILYSTNPKNPQGMFSIPDEIHTGLASASQFISENNAKCLASGKSIKGLTTDRKILTTLSPDIISSEYQSTASSLYNLIQNVESKMNLQ